MMNVKEIAKVFQIARRLQKLDYYVNIDFLNLRKASIHIHGVKDIREIKAVLPEVRTITKTSASVARADLIEPLPICMQFYATGEVFRGCRKVTRVIEVNIPAQPAIEAHKELKEVTDYICGKQE